MSAILDIQAPQQHAGKPSLAGLGRAELRAALSAAGVPEAQLRMRTGQLWSWIYAHGATSFDEMSDVSKDLRARLAQLYTLARPEIVREQVYLHELPGPEHAIDWVRGSMLGWYAGRLSPELYAEFERRDAERLLAVLDPARPFPLTYRRLLLWATL